MANNEYYEALGVSKTASAEEIRKAGDEKADAGLQGRIVGHR